MNRIFIIGNGFDLSHNLQVGYNDYLNAALRLAVDSQTEDKLFEILYPTFFRKNGVDFDTIINNQLTAHQNYNEVITRMSRILSHTTISGKGDNVNNYLKWNNQIIYKVFSQENISWSGFEQSYYEWLLEIFESNKWKKSQSLSDSIIKFNSEFEYLKRHFEDYLNKVTYAYLNHLKPINGYSTLFNQNKEKFKGQTNTISSSLYLSFNYTNLLEGLYNVNLNDSSQIINIHGQLLESLNPIIFGYGDETDKNYEKIEDMNLNDALDNFKSIQYSLTSNFQDMSSYVDSGDFVVHILGHSCGITDRVLLKYIFEHSNCKKITIHQYGGKNGHLSTVKNITRHFTDKNSIRHRVMPYSPSHELPQY